MHHFWRDVQPLHIVFVTCRILNILIHYYQHLLSSLYHNMTIRANRRFLISGYALEIIEKLQELHPDSEYICSSSKGTPITTNRFNENLKRFCQAAGVPYYSSHKIRFYAVSEMYDQGVNETTIQRLAGHNNLSTTRHYNRKLRDYTLDDDVLEHEFGLPAG